MKSDARGSARRRINELRSQPENSDLAKYPVEVLEAVLVILASELDREREPGPAKRNEKPVNGQ